MSSTYVNPKLVAAEYAVRGLIAQRAGQIGEELAKGTTFEKFTSTLSCHIGNPQAIGQKPLTYYRQVSALVDAPMLLENEKIVAEFPADVVARAKAIHAEIGPTTGAYTTSNGYAFARRDVAHYITTRDRKNSGDDTFPAAVANDIVLTDGSSTGVRMMMTALLDGAKDAALIPIPQYPLYSALLTLMDATAAPYNLRESEGWAMPIADLVAAKDAAIAKGSTPRILVIINPGNPTGQVLSKENMEAVVRFAHENKLLILADEVYQENIYAPNQSPFHSFREVILGMKEEKYAKETMCASLQTTSKGIIGECGRRGGYFEMLNFPAAVREQIVKLTSINLCANVNGQVMVSLMCRGPSPGEASYDSHTAEYNAIYDALKAKAALLQTELNTIPGFSCNPVEGAMYAFPRITLPAKYVAYNEEKCNEEGRKMPADTRWALELLEEYGIVIVSGSGFGQEEGTFHFRTTILPPATEMERFITSVKAYQAAIIAKYGN
jgi:alanine transaminase